MECVQEWLWLGDALSQVMKANGFTQEKAQHYICGAIEDGKIRLRFALFQPFRGLVHFAGGDPHDPWVPKQLPPADLDWSNSRPRRPWPPRGTWRDPLYSPSEWLNRWLVTWLEVRACDVTTVLCAGGDKPPQQLATAPEENRAIRALATYMTRNKDLSRADAIKWCRTQGFKPSGRGFQQRLWPQARARAGLPPMARAGRKRTSLR